MLIFSIEDTLVISSKIPPTIFTSLGSLLLLPNLVVAKPNTLPVNFIPPPNNVLITALPPFTTSLTILYPKLIISLVTV